MNRSMELINKQQMHKGVLLYVGYNSYGRTKYYTPTDDELKKLLSVTDEVLLIPITTYNRFTDDNGEERLALTMEDVEALTVDMIGDPNRYDIIKSEYAATATPKINANYHVQEYVDDATSLAKRMVAINPNVRLWFSVSLAECLHALTYKFADSYIATIKAIKATLPAEIWDNNLQGIYYTGEDIVTSGYTKFDPSIPDEDFNNPIVKTMRALSDCVHSYGKNMLWIPYYHEAAPSSKNLGYVVNLTDIFDTVIIQPSFFFNAARTDEIRIISECVRRQAVVDINGEIIGGEKKSNTRIGFEMEIDSQYFDKEGYPERYLAYEKGFGEFVGEYPTAYYAGAPETMLKLCDVIGKFFGK